MGKININTYKTKDDIAFKKVYEEWCRINPNLNNYVSLINDYESYKIKQVELKLKKQLEEFNDIKQYGYIGCVGLAGRV